MSSTLGVRARAWGKDLDEGLDETDEHDGGAKGDGGHGSIGLPGARGELDIAQRGQDVSEGAGAGGADELEEGAKIAGEQADEHGGEHEGRRVEDVEVHVERGVWVEVGKDDFATDESFEGQGGEHVEAETETGNVDHGVCGRKVVEHVALREGAKGEEAAKGHESAGNHGDEGAVVRDASKAINGRRLEGSVDEEGVVVADKRC